MSAAVRGWWGKPRGHEGMACFGLTQASCGEAVSVISKGMIPTAINPL